MAERNLEVNIIARDRATRPIKNIQSTIIRFVGAVSAALAGLRAVVFPINQAREFDRALRDVQKTTGFVDEEIKLLGSSLISLSTQLDTSATDLAKIAAAAGQLGLGEEGGQAIVSFTESVARAATTLNLTAEQAATSFAKIGSIFKIPVENTENLISTVNELSNTTVATADQLIDVLKRTGQITGTFQESAALAAQALQLGVSPEVAGTSLVKIFSNFTSKADQFAEQFGIDVGDFLGKGVVERWQFYLTELSKLSENESSQIINKLSGSGRVFALVTKQLQDARNGFDIFNKTLRSSQTAFEEGDSAIREYEQVSKSLNVQLDILRNNFNALAINVGQAVLPQLISLTQRLAEFLQSDRVRFFFDRLAENLAGAIDAAEDFVAALSDIAGGPILNFLTLVSIAVGVTLVNGIVNATRALVRFTASFIPVGRALEAGAGSLMAFRNSLNFIMTGTGSASVGLGQLSTTYATLTTQTNAATTSTLAYADATKVATAGLVGLRSAGVAGIAGGAGAGAFSTINQASIQRQLTSLQAQQRAQQAIVASQKDSLRVGFQRSRQLQERINVLRRADQLQGRTTELGRRATLILEQQRREQVAINAAARQRLNTAIATNAALTTRVGIFARLNAARTADALAATATQGRNTITVFQRIGAQFSRIATLAGPLGVAIRGVAVAFRGLLALVGGIPGAIILGLVFFLDDAIALFNRFFGSVEEGTVALTGLLRREANKRQAILDQELAAFKRIQQEIERGGEVDTGFELLAGTESIEQLNNAAATGAEQFIRYTAAAAGAQQEISRINTELNKLGVQDSLLQVQLTTAETTEEAEKLTQEIIDNGKAALDLGGELNKTRDQLFLLKEGIATTREELTRLFTPGVIDTIQLVRNLRNVQVELRNARQLVKDLSEEELNIEAVAELNPESRQRLQTNLAQLLGDTGVIDLGAPLEEQAADAQRFLEGVKRNVVELEVRVEAFGEKAKKAIGELEGRDAERFAAFDVLSRSAEQVEALADVAEEARAITREYNTQEQSLIDNQGRIISTLLSEQRINEELKEQGDNLEKNRKAAQGIFDNSTSEARAFAKEIANINKGIDDILETRVRTLRIDRFIESSNTNIEARTQEIAELQEQIANSTDTYQNNLDKARIRQLQNLNTLDEATKRDLEREKAQQRLNQLQSQIPQLVRQAEQAAGAGNVAAFTAIKDQIEAAVGEGGDIIGDLAGLQDAQGNFLFREGEIRSFQAALSGAAQPFQEAIPGLNQQLLDAARDAEREIATAIKDSVNSLGAATKEFAELVKLIPSLANNAGEINQQIVDAWKEANEPFNQTVDNFGNILRDSVLSGQGLVALNSNLSALTQAAEAAARAAQSGNLTASIDEAKIAADAAKKETQTAIATLQGQAIGQAGADTLNRAVAEQQAKISAAAREEEEGFFTKAFNTLNEFRKTFVGGILEGFLSGPSAGFANLGESIAEGFISKISQFLANSARGFRGDAIPGRAAGGLISGPGSATSDSILARLSNGEYVSDAGTVAALGVPFFQNLKRIARGRSATMSRYRGGLPAFADGGFVNQGNSSYRPVNINIPGVGSYPMLAQGSVVEEVARVVSRESLKRGTKGRLR